jgi:heterodisulfide reductase subunit A-like polyferredoxin
VKVEVTVRIDGREVAILEECISGQAIDVEQQTERLKDRVGQVVLAEGFSQLAATLRRPWCCGKPMQNKGPRRVTIMSQSGEISFNRTRYRCRECRQ